MVRWVGGGENQRRHNSNSTLGGVELTCSGEWKSSLVGVDMELSWSLAILLIAEIHSHDNHSPTERDMLPTSPSSIPPPLLFAEQAGLNL